MSSVEEKFFLQLIKFSYDLSLKVTRTFVKTNILHQYNDSFVEFLDTYKHELYHLWNNTTRCCACSSNSLLQQNQELHREQFLKLYDIQGPISHGHFRKGKGQTVTQHCLCGVNCIASCSLNDLDIILIHTIIKKCTKLRADDDLWLKTIREIRNNLSHAVSTTYFDQGSLEDWWVKLEGSVLGLAGKVPLDSYAELVNDQIKLLKIANLDRNAVQEILSKIEDNKKMYEDVKTEIKNISSDNNQKVEQEHVETRKQICQLNKELIKKFEDQEKNIVCRIFQELGATGFQRKEMVEASCQVNLENIDEENVLRNIQQQEHAEKNSDFDITAAKRNCIILELKASPDIFLSAETFHQAVRSLIERIVEAGELDSNVPYSIHVDLTFKTQLTQDELRIISSLSTLQLNIGGEQVRPDKHDELRIISSLTTLHLNPDSRPDRHGLGIALCDLCKESKEVLSISWCPECNVTLCVDCIHNHNEDHPTVDIDPNLDLQLIKSQEYCPKHVQQKVEYYCLEHEFICCPACLDDKHKSCKEVISIDVACKNAKRSTILEELGMEMNNINRSLACLEEEINTNISDINIESQDIESKIVEVKTKAINQINESEVKTKAINQINESETILASQLQVEKMKIITEQQKVKKKCQTISDKMIDRCNVTRIIIKHGTEKQVFILANHLKQTVDETDDTVATILSSKKSAKLSFDEKENVMDSILSLGRINISEQPSQVKHTPVKQKHAQCIVQRANKPLTSFKLTSTFRTSDSVNTTGMIVTEDNKLLLCNFNKPEVLVYHDNGQYISTITMKRNPYDIAIIPGGDQYVVTMHVIGSIQYINSQDLTPGRCVKLPTPYLTCGIAADTKYIYVGGYCRIYVLNHEGSVVREIMLNYYAFVEYLAVNDNNIYASGFGSIIYYIDHNNETRQSEVMGAGMIQNIITDRQGYIYVAGEGSGKVHQLDKELKQAMIVGDHSVEVITAICFNKNCTKLFVASERGKKIAVFRCS